MRMQHWEIDKLVLSQLSAWEEILQAALKKETGCFSLLERLHKKCAISIGVLMKCFLSYQIVFWQDNKKCVGRAC